MLNRREDLKTLLYMGAMTALLALQWASPSFNPLAYLLMLFLAVAVPIMGHGHGHTPMWRSGGLNALSDYWFTLFQGHPAFVFAPTHNDNHHRYINGERDWTRVWRYRDDNALPGLLMHPGRCIVTLYPHISRHLRDLAGQRPLGVLHAGFQYALLIVFVAGAHWLDVSKALLYVVIPQAVAIFWLLGANYFQHAHTDEQIPYQHSRNFTGLINPLLFNIGLHTAHHEQPDLHWSDLPAAHRRVVERVSPLLNERSFAWYCTRTFFLAAWIPAFRSRPIRVRPAV